MNQLKKILESNKNIAEFNQEDNR